MRIHFNKITLAAALYLIYIVQTLYTRMQQDPIMIATPLPPYIMISTSLAGVLLHAHRNSGVCSEGSVSSLSLRDPTATTVTLRSGSTVCSR